MSPYEYFDHTADMGLRVRGKDLPELFTSSALGMFNLIVPLEQFKAQDSLDVLLEAPDVEELLWKWLRELHYLFATQKLVFREFEYKELNEKMVWATCSGGYFDPQKHVSEREVKAVTHHGFTVTKESNGWKAEVIFDI
jgi:SHS2 domain-containing protein